MGDETKTAAILQLGVLLVTLPQAAEALSVGRTTLYELVNTGRLATVRVGRRRLVPASALVALVDELQRQDVA